MTWDLVQHREAVSAFHARPIPQPCSRAVWVCEPTGPALVLGSAQSGELVDREACDRAGVEVVRRRSGGGAVLVEPGGLLWVDVLLAPGDPLWEADVGRAFGWLGATWQGALADLGFPTTVHEGALRRSPWSDLVCFAGVGPGELIAPDGAKVVGISQRRQRHGVRFQCAALGRWEPSDLLELLAVEPSARGPARDELAAAAAPTGADLGVLLDAFLRRLP